MTEPRHILVIGIGAGNPDYMTVQAIDALNRVDVFFLPDKGAEKAELRELRETICARFITRPDYRFSVILWLILFFEFHRIIDKLCDLSR